MNEADETGCTALFWAAFLGQADVVRLLLADQDVDVNKANANGCTALHLASLKCYVKVVRLLLARQDVEPNQAIANGATALYVASQGGHVEVVRLLLARQGVEVNKNLQDGSTALIIASDCGHVEIVRLLLARQGVEVNQATKLGYSALILASQNGHVEVARRLLAHPGVKTRQTTLSGWSALGAASKCGHGAIVSLFVAHRAHGQVRLLAADAIDSLPAVLFKELPGFTAQAAALRLGARRGAGCEHARVGYSGETCDWAVVAGSGQAARRHAAGVRWRAAARRGPVATRGHHRCHLPPRLHVCVLSTGLGDVGRQREHPGKERVKALGRTQADGHRHLEALSRCGGCCGGSFGGWRRLLRRLLLLLLRGWKWKEGVRGGSVGFRPGRSSRTRRKLRHGRGCGARGCGAGAAQARRKRGAGAVARRAWHGCGAARSLASVCAK